VERHGTGGGGGGGGKVLHFMLTTASMCGGEGILFGQRRCGGYVG
jgi:hypothetical protein